MVRGYGGGEVKLATLSFGIADTCAKVAASDNGGGMVSGGWLPVFSADESRTPRVKERFTSVSAL